MSDIAIKVENLSKKFEIGQQKSGDLRSSFGEKLKKLISSGTGSEMEDFWALRDINFEIKKGEAVGIIGRNGAGKSTLLKILSRITEPTKGRFEINGRVSSLLEVGTGFHPELTGRENIFLNGTILGMKRAEIKRKLDEIIEFSGVAKFIDTPVKHYSSGMKVRLAFSVAAHLEPEILIVDEVLAVGDAEFQKKCLGKMDEVSKEEGRTILFVSHNMGAVESLCTYGLVLGNGKMMHKNSIANAISYYFNQMSSFSTEKDFQSNRFIKKIQLFCNDQPSTEIFSGSNMKVKIHMDGDFEFDDLIVGLAFFDYKGMRIAGINNKVIGRKLNNQPTSSGVVTIEIPVFPVYDSGTYMVNVHLGNRNEDLEVIDSEVYFNVVYSDIYRSGVNVPAKWGKFFFPGIQFNYSTSKDET